jgi:putative membrane protein
MEHSSPTAEPLKHKLNHSYIWLGALRAVPYILIAMFASLSNLIFELIDDSLSDGYVLVVLILSVIGLIVITGIVMLIRFVSYRYIWYEYAGDEFSYFSGIFSKKRVHIPYQRIQSVNQRASLFQRIAGVCTVSIETAGGAENKAVLLPYIERSAAEALRKELFERKQLAQMRAAGIQIPEDTAVQMPIPQGNPISGIPAPDGLRAQNLSAASQGNALDAPARLANDFRGVFGGEAIDTGQISAEYGLSNKQLILGAITGKNSFTMVFFSLIAGIASLISSIGFMFGASEDQLFTSLSSLVNLIPSSWIIGAIASIVGFVLAIMLVIWLLTVIGTCISYGGFHARRRGSRIETEYGIINHNFNGIDIDRIQSIEISQSFFQRLLKSCTLSLARVASAAKDASSDARASARQSSLVIHPFIKLDQVEDVLGQLLPEWEGLPQASKPIPKRALRRAIVRRSLLQGGGFWLALCTFVTMLFLSLPLHFDTMSYGELMDYLSLYVLFDIIARVLYVLAALIFIVDVISALLWQRGSGFGYDRAYITIMNSGFSTNRIITPRNKVQLATMQTNPLQRHKKLVTIIALTAAGVGSSTLKLIDVEQDAAKDWFEWCHPGGNKTLSE